MLHTKIITVYCKGHPHGIYSVGTKCEVLFNVTTAGTYTDHPARRTAECAGSLFAAAPPIKAAQCFPPQPLGAVPESVGGVVRAADLAPAGESQYQYI
jgi:hypothetical protein